MSYLQTITSSYFLTSVVLHGSHFVAIISREVSIQHVWSVCCRGGANRFRGRKTRVQVLIRVSGWSRWANGKGKSQRLAIFPQKMADLLIKMKYMWQLCMHLKKDCKCQRLSFKYTSITVDVLKVHSFLVSLCIHASTLYGYRTWWNYPTNHT